MEDILDYIRAFEEWDGKFTKKYERKIYKFNIEDF
jgi:hypothetical protein